MFSPQIVESEEFVTMPLTSQALYFHLAMAADDDGFVQPKIIMRTLGSNEDDLKVLIAKRFLLTFESGVVVIKHWLIHNIIRQDRYKKTRFKEEKKTLKIRDDDVYTELGLQSDNQMAAQVRLGEVSIGKVNLRESDENPAQEFFSNTDMQDRIIKDMVEKGGNETLVRREITKFILYWTESNGKKQRWQGEKYFDVKRRLITWFGRVKDFNQNKVANI